MADGTYSTPGIFDFTAQTTGTYDITAYRAQGGGYAFLGHPGGLGAEIGGDFVLTAGEQLEIVVGGQGYAGDLGSTCGYGGGGGSFVLSGPYTALVIGDLVTTSDGRRAPVRWIGRQTVSRRFADPLRVLPIRIRAGALADNEPSRDLLLSPCHAIRVGDILILAEGVAAETFIDNADRMAFDNWDEHLALFPEGHAIEEMPLPGAQSHRQLPAAVRRMLRARADAMTESAALAA